MKTKKILLSVFLTLLSVLTANAQTWDYTETFADGASLNGTLTSSGGGNQSVITNGYWNHEINGASAPRFSTFTMNKTIEFSKKMIVEFEWAPGQFRSGGGDEGQIRFRDAGNNVLFTAYTMNSASNEIRFATGDLNGESAANVNMTYNAGLNNTPIRTPTSSAPDPAWVWYRVKAEIYSGERICFTVTGITTTSYNRTLMLPVPQNFNSTDVNNIYCYSTRNGSGVNVIWNTRIRNLNIRVADDDAEVEATGVSVSSNATSISAAGGSATLTATVNPFNVSAYSVSWEVDNNLATITPSMPPWTATLKANDQGGGTVTVTASSSNGNVFGTTTINIVAPVAVEAISISGPDELQVYQGITFTINPTPSNASKTVIWTSDDPTVASVTTNFSDVGALVTGVTAGTTTIRAVAASNSSITDAKTVTVTPSTLPKRQMELLDRGLAAVKSGSDVFFSWRLYATDPDGVQFNLYRNDETTPFNPSPLGAANTNFVLTNGATNALYSVATLVGGTEVERSKQVGVWNSDNQYLAIAVEKPVGRLYNGSTYSTYSDYYIGDASVADLDGDGQYEIIFLWTPANAQDNANSGRTANVFIDAYKLDGTKLWGAGKFIDLGPNIRAGAHYNPFLVYDFDGDGKAEIIVKTADGTTDALGERIGSTANHSTGSGYILSGDEFITVFEGVTGKILNTQPFKVARGGVGTWGDDYGNRVDRFLSCVAYLDGERPSAVMGRGYYARTTLSAWDWDGETLKERWIFDTRPDGVQNSQLSRYEGQGNHNLSVADVDGDGKDEIIYGSLTIGSNGEPLYSTNYRHGDAMHTGKFDPSRPGLQVMGVHESPNPYGMKMQDAATGALIWGLTASGDIGRGLCADIDPEYPGVESWSSGGFGVYSAQGQRLAADISTYNMAIWWDGDTGRELFDAHQAGGNARVMKITASDGPGGNSPRSYSNGVIFNFDGTSANAGTKANPCLQADIIGDWREEMIMRSADNSEIRIYTTVTPTVHIGAGAVPATGIPTLMHDPVYRMAIAWQNVGYNQPPHTGFFLGYNMENIPREAGSVLTVTFDPDGGTFDDNSTVEKQMTSVSGAYFAFPNVTNPKKALKGWYLSNGEKFDPTVIYKDDISLKAVWVEPEKYQLTVVNGSSSIYEYFAEDLVAIQAEAAPAGKQFKEWIIEPTVTFITGSHTTPTAEFTMPDKAVIATATYEDVIYLITVTDDGNGNANASANSALMNEVIELTATANTGYYFALWEVISENVNLSSVTANPATFVMPDESVEIKANFAPNPKYTVTVINGLGSGSFEAGVTVEMQVNKANEGQQFKEWVIVPDVTFVTGDITTLYVQFVMPAENVTATATYENITNVSEISCNNINVYPNPAEDIVSISGLDGGETITFVDASGRLCLQIKAANSKEDISVNHLAKGTYLVVIKKGKSEKTVRLVIN